jgi:C4-dicarboxylate-specific signal transduction histidine kinase
MRLHEADCYLEYARLFVASGEKDKARESLDRAKKMIEAMGYHRRDGECQRILEQING